MLSLSQRVLCVDWDRLSVRLVVARTGRGVVSLEDAHSHLVPAEVDADDPTSMGSHIAGLLKQHHLRQHRVILAVPRDKAVINRLALPPTPADELAAAVQFQSLRELPFPMDEAVVDFVVTARNEANLATEVLVAAVRKDVLERIRETARAAGLAATRIGLRPYANLVSLRHLPGLDGQRVMLIDVGPATTEIDVVSNGQLVFSRAASITLGDQATVEDTTPVDDATREEAIRALTVEITRTLQAYRASEPDGTVDRVVIAGGTGLEEVLQQTVRERFQMECELFDPSGPLGLDAADGAKLRSFCVPLGLAWGLSREGMLDLDFLNPTRPIPRGETLRKRVRRGAIAAAALVVAALGWYTNERMSLAEANRELRKELTALKEQDLERRFIQTQIERTEELDERQQVWLDHLLALSMGATVPAENTEPPQPGEAILIEGLTFDETAETIRMLLLGRTFDDVSRYAEVINSLRDDGRQMYRVPGFAWTPAEKIAGYAGGTRFMIDLVRLSRLTDEISKAERERKREFKELQRVYR